MVELQLFIDIRATISLSVSRLYGHAESERTTHFQNEIKKRFEAIINVNMPKKVKYNISIGILIYYIQGENREYVGERERMNVCVFVYKSMNQVREKHIRKLQPCSKQ